MTPVLTGRLQTRLYLTGTVGTIVTGVLTPLLPRPSGMDIGSAYRMTFESIALMAFLGLAWELGYHLVQQTRWDKDWPSLLGLLTVGNEGTLLWYVDHALGVIPGTAGIGSPFLALFAIHVAVTWLAMWLFLQGPVRVLHLRWRFEGSRVLVPAPGRWRRDDDWLDTRWLESLRSPNVVAEPPTVVTDTADVVGIRRSTAPLVDGVLCPNGHFGSADVRYCVVCGTSTVSSTASTGPRPPLGMLILADGRTQVLADDLAVTESDGTVAFQPLTEPATERVIAEIRLVGWQPVVSSELRAVSVVLPGGARLRATPDVGVPLVPGASVVIGPHTIRYDSPYAADPDVSTEVVHEKGVPVIPNGTKAKRVAAVAAAVVTLVGAILLGVLGGSTGQADRRATAQPGPTTPLLPPFSVPPWTLPSQPTSGTNGVLPIELPGPPTGPVFHLPPPPVPVLPGPPSGPRPTPTPVPPTTTTTPSTTDTPPVTPLPTSTLCDVNLLGMLQCTLGGLGG